MSAVGTAFNWVLSTGGVWTRIWQGPMVSGIPFQALELATTGSFSASITWKLDGYSAAIPFYSRFGGTTTIGFAGTPPIGHVGSYAAVLGFHVTPWVEFWLLTNRSCFAHIAVF